MALSICCIGPLDQAKRIVQPLRSVGSPLADQVAPTPYLDIQAAGDQIFPTGLRYYWKSHFVKDAMRSEGKSMRAVARALGVSAMAVSRALAELGTRNRMSDGAANARQHVNG